MATNNPFIKGLLAAVGVVIALGMVVVYKYALDLQLAGYRARKAHELEMVKRRDARRRTIPTIPSVRERMLKEEFGDLPEIAEVRIDMELVDTWQELLLLLFAPFSVGAVLYIVLGRRRTAPQRWLRGLVVLIGASQALPMLLLPTDALRFVRVFAIPLVVVALIVLAVIAIRDRLSEMRQAETAT